MATTDHLIKHLLGNWVRFQEIDCIHLPREIIIEQVFLFLIQNIIYEVAGFGKLLDFGFIILNSKHCFNIQFSV